jgi:transposase
MGDNPLCVNTNGHLWLGTARDNNHDMMQKGRQIFLHGEDVRHAKLTEPDIYAICALRDALSQDAIAQRFGIAQTTVGDILRGEKWRHVRRDTPPRRPHAEQVATLTRDQVYAIRRLQGTMTEAKAAARFGVSGSQIGRIWKRECWAWLPEEENR